MESILQTTDLRKTYHKGAAPIPVLNGISLEITGGEFVSVVGRSGSGKSTLLNLIGGLDTPTSGRIIVGNGEVTAMSRLQLVQHRRSTVGMVFQSFNLIHSKSALENVALALIFGNHGRRDRRAKAGRLLSLVGLEHRLDHTPSELSGGEAQRVAIARALANDPLILLADEPTGNLDSKTSREIIELLHELNQEQHVTVIMVTHDEEGAAAVSNRILRLLDGRITDELTLRSNQ